MMMSVAVQKSFTLRPTVFPFPPALVGRIARVAPTYSLMPTTRSKDIPKIGFTSNEVNYLVYAYLIDSGFEHAAYNLRSEARLDISSDKKAYIQRNALVHLLSKALLYVEVESHFREDGRPSSCTAPFSLLGKHVCSTSSRTTEVIPVSVDVSPAPDAVGSPRDHLKRKASAKGRESSGGKRAKIKRDVELEEMQSGTRGQALLGRTVVPSHEHTNGRPVTKVQDRMSSPFEVDILGRHESAVYMCAWNPSDPGLLAAGSKDAAVCIWDAGTRDGSNLNEKMSDSQALTSAEITCLDWSPDGTLLAIGSMDTYLRVWEKNGNMHMHSNVVGSSNIAAHNVGSIFSVRFSPSGRLLAACLLDGTVTVWDMKEKRPKIHLRSHRSSCLDVDWRDEHMFASCGADGQIVLASLNPSGSHLGWQAHSGEVNQIRFNGTHNMMASCSDDGTAKIWEIPPLLASSTVQDLANDPEKLLVSTLHGHSQRVTRVMWSNLDGQTLATCSFDSTARLWNAKTGTCLRVIQGHSRHCFTACFSPDGAYLASAGGDGSVFVTSVKTGDRIAEWKDVKNGVVFDVQCRTINGRLRLIVSNLDVFVVN